eukprot:358302-Chlamydomonas_euryale.AAC.5
MASAPTLLRQSSMHVHMSHAAATSPLRARRKRASMCSSAHARKYAHVNACWLLRATYLQSALADHSMHIYAEEHISHGLFFGACTAIHQ